MISFISGGYKSLNKKRLYVARATPCEHIQSFVQGNGSSNVFKVQSRRRRSSKTNCVGAKTVK